MHIFKKPSWIRMRIIKSNQMKSRMKHKDECEYVDRTQRQYKTALTGALKIQTRKNNATA